MADDADMEEDEPVKEEEKDDDDEKPTSLKGLTFAVCLLYLYFDEKPVYFYFSLPQTHLFIDLWNFINEKS